jgi:hypothetical protein
LRIALPALHQVLKPDFTLLIISLFHKYRCAHRLLLAPEPGKRPQPAAPLAGSAGFSGFLIR